MPRWTANDWVALGFWISVGVLIAIVDLVFPRLFGTKTVSETTRGWCGEHPWVGWVITAVFVFLILHLTVGYVPFSRR